MFLWVFPTAVKAEEAGIPAIINHNFCLSESAATQVIETWEQKGWDAGKEAFSQEPSCYAAGKSIPVILKSIKLRKVLINKGFVVHVALVEVECAMCSFSPLFVIFMKTTTVKALHM